jgi:site-specific DNA recombinase
VTAGIAFAYVRVSSVNPSHHASERDHQIALIEDWAIENGYELAGTFVDAGVTGKTAPSEREGWCDLMNAVVRNPGALVIVSDISRLARRGVYIELAIDSVVSAGGRVAETHEGVYELETDLTPEQVLTRKILELLAEYDRSKTVRKLSDGKRSAASQGRYIGGPLPFGTKLVDGMLVSDGRCEEVVRLRDEESLTMREIASRMDTSLATVQRCLAKTRQQTRPTSATAPSSPGRLVSGQ